MASPIPCVLVLAFLDGDGKILKQMVASVASGKAAFVDLAVNTMLAGRQQEIHAERDRKLEEARKQRQIRRRQIA